MALNHKGSMNISSAIVYSRPEQELSLEAQSLIQIDKREIRILDVLGWPDSIRASGRCGARYFCRFLNHIKGPITARA